MLCLLQVHFITKASPFQVCALSLKPLPNLTLFEELKQSRNQKVLSDMKNALNRLTQTAPASRRHIVQMELDGFSQLFEHFLFEEAQHIIWDRISVLPKDAVQDYSTLHLPSSEKIHQLLSKLIVVKLNGGLGTSMGCEGPKSVITVRNDMNFLDLTVEQILYLNSTYGTNVPLVLMNSFNTESETQKMIEKYKGLNVQIHCFNQSCYPRTNESSFLPVAADCDIKSNKEAWYPPGHGDFYESFSNSGLLNQFIEEGRKYCFISNIDNLGAEVDLKILNLMDSAQSVHGGELEFLMEVTEKTKADVKGGALVIYEEKLQLLETAQIPKEHLEDFKSNPIFKYFNTNNLWIKLNAVKRNVEEKWLEMEVIVNKKKMSNGLPVIQLETAVGAAMKSFDGSKGVNVPRRRFLPVKKTSDLLLVMSNLYKLKNGSLSMNPLRGSDTVPLVHLSEEYYKEVKDFLARFQNIPDILELEFLTVSGNVYFSKGVSLKGTVIIFGNGSNKVCIPPNAMLQNKIVKGALNISDF
ncbi:UTP--glucose-1-phosphate uridylyltransferase-like [Schistocerca serialis cubense]|uniref:UTP--glucose-1-phosphate uridylyltransferase-like n=1 Tax=Schistocerca serialis cubense TaxID=2023355 RepID=UPI00214E5F75|nr:UTP--glucose-1-phosphate uridylyltransferase-like [Schistocerca serialis cubense]